MKKVHQIFIICSFLIAISLFNLELCVAEDLESKDAGIVPWGEIKIQYDDNIFLDSNNEKDDLIVTLTPGISAELPISDNLLKFDYHVDFIEFADYSSQDTTNHYLSGEAQINWRDVSFTIYDDFERVFERPSTEDTSRVKRDDNTAGVTASLERYRLGIQLGYEHFVRNYRSEPAYEGYDRTEDLYSVMLTHQTFPETKLLLEYDFTQIKYEESTHSDSDYNQILIGAMGDLTPKTNATIKIGYQWRKYDNSDEPDFDSAVLYADMVHKFSDKNALKLSFLRSAQESTYGVNNYYKIENVSAVLDHYFSNKLLGFVTGIYQINAYPRETTESSETKKRKDGYYSLGTGLKYYMKDWLTFTLHAEHIIRESNFDIYDYDQNLITFTTRAEF